jgi:hypothetical protein
MTYSTELSCHENFVIVYLRKTKRIFINRNNNIDENYIQ